jgi:hypothetical protein
MVRGGILGLEFVKLVCILQVSLMLLVSRPCKVFCQVFESCSLIAESICSFKELMRGRRVMSLVLYHCVRSLLFLMRTRVEVAICIDLKVLLFSVMSYRAALLMRVSVRCLSATLISLFEQFPSMH